jgi:hypothetical protein
MEESMYHWNHGHPLVEAINRNTAAIDGLARANHRLAESMDTLSTGQSALAAATQALAAAETAEGQAVAAEAVAVASVGQAITAAAAKLAQSGTSGPDVDAAVAAMNKAAADLTGSVSNLTNSSNALNSGASTLNAAGNPPQQQATVSITADQQTVAAGTSVNLTIQAAGATALALSDDQGDQFGALDVTGGTVAVSPNVTTVYTATATSADGSSVVAQVTVTVQ